MSPDALAVESRGGIRMNKVKDVESAKKEKESGRDSRRPSLRETRFDGL